MGGVGKENCQRRYVNGMWDVCKAEGVECVGGVKGEDYTFIARPASMIASEDPTVAVPIHSQLNGIVSEGKMGRICDHSSQLIDSYIPLDRCKDI